jgi:hypothetical protein
VLRGNKDEAIRRIMSPHGLDIDEAVEILKPEVDTDMAIRREQYRQVYQFERENFGYGENKTAFSIFIEPGERRRLKHLEFMSADEIQQMVSSVEKRKESLMIQIGNLDVRLQNLRGLQRNYTLPFDEQSAEESKQSESNQSKKTA